MYVEQHMKSISDEDITLLLPSPVLRTGVMRLKPMFLHFFVGVYEVSVRLLLKFLYKYRE